MRKAPHGCRTFKRARGDSVVSTGRRRSPPWRQPPVGGPGGAAITVARAIPSQKWQGIVRVRIDRATASHGSGSSEPPCYPYGVTRRLPLRATSGTDESESPDG